MNNTLTPESYTLDFQLHNPRVLEDRYSSMLEHACKLERERDEAREERDKLKQLLFADAENVDAYLGVCIERDEARDALKHIEEYGTDEINAAVELRQKLAQALVDLDNMQDQRDLAMKVIKRLERERDEAREALEEEKKWHHRTHKELIEAQCKLLDIEYDKLKS